MGEGFSGWYTIAVNSDDSAPHYKDAAWACPVPGEMYHERTWNSIDCKPRPGFPTLHDAEAYERYVGGRRPTNRHVTADELRVLVAMWRAQREAER